jgi:predicted ATPase
MITTWRLRNFKSIRDAEIPMGPLTVFAGANSSGKSTLIQSILLVSQTSASKVRSRTVVLNGHLTKLGQFDDLLSAASGEGKISIGWDCRPRRRSGTEMPSEDAESIPRGSLNRRRGLEIKSISCDISLDVDRSDPQRDLMQFQPRMLSCTLSSTTRTRKGEATSSVEVRRATMAPHDKRRQLQLYGRRNTPLIFSLEYDVALDEGSLEELREELTSAEAVGCLFRHFLPERLSVRYDEAEEQARLIASAICELRPRFPTHLTRQLYTRDIVIPSEVFELLEERLGDSVRPLLKPPAVRQQLLFEDSSESVTLRGWYDGVRSLSVAERRAIDHKIQADESLADDISDVVKAQRLKTQGGSQYALRLYPPERLIDAFSYLDKFFSTSIRYIGPLRDEPKSVYPLAATEDPSNVGLRGEYTAAVLDLHKDRRIKYIPAANFEQPSIDNASFRSTLKGAVLDWLRYMGVAEGVETRDMGKLGHQLQIASSGSEEPRDLTHVGVGVSQVLPVLVACLLADDEATLVFEQPELHLHPRVQTLLADFFLSMALLGKQCIIETHSEYLINRLRFRMASATKGDLSSTIKTYFVEKKDGDSHFRKVDINQYGAILNWPEGFFDQSQREAENILRAAVTKKKQERAHGENT